LRLSYFEEMPHSAISSLLGIPLGTVKSRIRMACEKLRWALQQSR
ncbi:sigma factor-like helix-turn-helix DNA-binding protein, partial [Paraburkholderia sp. SIMBA_030]